MKTFILPFICLIFGACTLVSPVPDDPVRHLLESSFPARTPTAASPAIAIARPSLPPYLERVELVTRNETGQLKIHDRHLWSEPLDAAITRVMADNLRRLTGSTNIQPVANFITRDYTALVEIRIDRFDPAADGSLIFECTWKVQPVTGSDASPKAFRTVIPISPSADPVGARIPAMNEALGRLARVIAKAM
jgi:uncharacterized lipoprotein YmbA